MKSILLFSVFLTLSVASFCQKTFVSIGGEIAIPGAGAGLKDMAGIGFGGSLRLESSWGKHTAGMVTIGYLGFASKDDPFSGSPPTTTSVKAILVQVGMKYYLEERKETPKGMFISAELGLMPTTIHFDYAVNEDRDYKESGLSSALGIGYQLGNIESGVRLQYNLTASGFHVYYYNFRIAYAFLKGKKKK